MADKIEVTVLKQKVFHDGTSMVVLKPKKGRETGKAFVDPKFIPGLIEDKVIDAPEGYGDLAPADDEDGEYVPPLLTGKNKAELLAIAEDEDVTIPEGATNAEIVKLIENARDAYDADGGPAA